MKNDPGSEPAPDTAIIRVIDLQRAVGLLTRLPVPLPDNPRASARAAWAYPVAGIIPGALAALIGSLAMTLGLGAAIAALLALASSIIVTGALHEDGLADCADGFWGGWTPERRLEIMRDSRIGTYGVLALVLCVGLRWAALLALFDAGLAIAALLSAAVLSRAVMPALMSLMPPARPGGLSHHVGRPPLVATGLAIGLAATLSVLFLNGEAPAAILAAGLVGLAVATLAQAKIGGQSGDVLGAAQQITEVTILVVLVARSAAFQGI
ncbi:MAG: adenosylcobinamide-GDP ribazoletransferase [Pseudomonadota bacterium]